MMELSESYGRLLNSEEFSSWKKKHQTAYLSHAFMMKDPHRDGTWEFGFSSDDNSVTVFEMKENISIRPPQEAFKKDDARIPPLDEAKIKSSVFEALAIIDGIVVEKYANQKPMKVMVVVQTLPPPIGQCWNISYVLHSFKILNVKIDTETKAVLDEKIVSLIQDG